MHMYDYELGEMEVELVIPTRNPELAYLSAGYKRNTFRELTEEELEYLNDAYLQDIVEEAKRILAEEFGTDEPELEIRKEKH